MYVHIHVYVRTHWRSRCVDGELAGSTGVAGERGGVEAEAGEARGDETPEGRSRA